MLSLSSGTRTLREDRQATSALSSHGPFTAYGMVTSFAPHENHRLMITTLGQTIVMDDMTRSAIVPAVATAADRTESAPGLCVIASTRASPEFCRTLARMNCSPSCTRTGRVSRAMSIYGNTNGPNMVPASIRCHQSAIPTTEPQKRSWITSRGL